MSHDVPCFPPRSYRNPHPSVSFRVPFRVGEFLMGVMQSPAGLEEVAVQDQDTLRVCLVWPGYPPTEVFIANSPRKSKHQLAIEIARHFLTLYTNGGKLPCSDPRWRLGAQFLPLSKVIMKGFMRSDDNAFFPEFQLLN